MEFVRLDEMQLRYVASACRTAEAATLRDRVLRPALANLDEAIRKAPIDRVQVMQGYARALADVIDLLTPSKQPSQPVQQKTVTMA